MSTTETGSGAEQHRFQAEVAQVLDIVIHSLYSNREIFLRELISNASDALDKLRFRSVTDQALLGEQKDLEIRVVPDQERSILTIADTGIGMTKEEMVENLGTIARSGSRRFLEALKSEGKSSEVELIGRFGVGFYSAFIVADQVVVRSRAAGSEQAWAWTSDAKESYSMEEDDDLALRGTTIELHLKDDALEFLDEVKLRQTIRKYSDFVSFPIKLSVTKTEGEGDEKTTTKELEQVNTSTPIWRRSKNEVKDEEYTEFYKSQFHDWEDPLAHVHFRAEGNVEFTGLLYVPKQAPFDLYDPESRRGVRLYVKRVFIMDDCKELLPEWLRFVRGVVDSEDLPLNVSREMLQQDTVTRSIRKSLTKRVLGALTDMAKERPDDFETFHKTFGAIIKEGLHRDPTYKDELSELFRWPSSKAELTSLAGYVERMKDDQQAIYYAYGMDAQAVRSSPHTEALAARDIEVLYMSDAIDEWVIDSLTEYDGKPLVSAMKAELKDIEDESDEAKEEREQKEKTIEPLVEKAKEVLSEHVGEVRSSRRLTDSPCCLVDEEHAMHNHVRKLLEAQNRGGMAPSQRILELNPEHELVQSLASRVEAGGSEEEIGDWIRLLHDQALLAEGSSPKDPQNFARKMTELLSGAVGGVKSKIIKPGDD